MPDIFGTVEKVKFYNHKGNKGYARRSQRAVLQSYIFVYFVPFLCSLWLKRTFSTAALYTLLTLLEIIAIFHCIPDIIFFFLLLTNFFNFPLNFFLSGEQLSGRGGIRK